MYIGTYKYIRTFDYDFLLTIFSSKLHHPTSNPSLTTKRKNFRAKIYSPIVF